MRKLTLFAFLFSLVSCDTVKIIDAGRVTVISHRNVDSKVDYQLLRTYAGGSEKELKESTSQSIENAIDETIKQVPGGEFLKNAKIYVIQKNGKNFFAAQGDIYGLKLADSAYNGFKVGDNVYWNNSNNPKSPDPRPGKVISIKNANTYLIELENKRKTKVEAPASKLYHR